MVPDQHPGSKPPFPSDKSLPPGRRFLLYGSVIFFAALFVRIVHVLQISEAPFFDIKMGDAASYDAWARTVAAGDWLGKGVFYQAPLYPYFLGVVYRFLGDGVLLVRMVQSFVGAASCLLLACAGRWIFSPPVGVAAGLMLAFYAPAIFYDGLLQKSVLDMFFLTLALCLWGRITVRPGSALWCGLGLTTGAMVLTRENLLILIPLLLGWLFIRYRGRARVVFLALFLAGTSAVLLPVALRNYSVGGEFHLTTSQLGPNFYIGNNENANGLYAPLKFGRGNPAFERQDAVDIAEEAEGRTLSPREVSRYWTRRALRYIRNQPGAWLRLMVRKTALALNAVEIVDTVDQYSCASWSLPLRWTGHLLHFGILAPLAFIGMAATWADRRKLWFLHFFLLLYLASLVMFYIFGRYRYPLVPVLLLFAAAGLAHFRSILQDWSWKRKLIVISTGVSVVVLCNLPVTDTLWMQAVTHYNVGKELYNGGDSEGAAGEYRSALTLKPDYFQVHNNLGYIYLERADYPRAITHFRQALSIKPDYTDAMFNMGLAHLQAGNLHQASRFFAGVLRVAPQDSESRMYLDYIRGVTERSTP